MKLIPKPHMLKSVRSRNWHLSGAIEELVDNSLGHGKADDVYVFINNVDGIAVIDNGTGIDDINRVFRFGDASSHDDLAEIGQYGVGAKNATIYLGNVVRVETVYDGRKHVMTVDWGEVERSGEWPDAYTGAGTRARSRDRGTSVFVAEMARTYHLKTSERLASELGHVFAPALRKGTQISVYHRLAGGDDQFLEVEPFTPLDLTDEVTIGGEVETSRGPLRWSGRVGLSATLTERHNGVHIAFGHRVIETTREPFHGESAPTLYCEVQLDETTPWKHSLAEHKDKVVRNRSDLIASIYEAIKPLLEKSSRQASYLALEGMTAPIESQLTRALKGAGVLHVDPDEEPQPGGRGEGDKPVEPGLRVRTPVAEGEEAKEHSKPTGVLIDWRTPESLEGKLWSWEISGKQMLILLDYEQFKNTVQFPPKVRDQHVIQLIAALLSHAIEREHASGSPALTTALTPKLRTRLDEWASERGGIAPYLNRVILEGAS